MKKIKLKNVIDVVTRYQVVSRLLDDECDSVIGDFDTYHEALGLVMDDDFEDGYYTIELVVYGKVLGEEDFEMETIIPQIVLLSTKSKKVNK